MLLGLLELLAKNARLSLNNMGKLLWIFLWQRYEQLCDFLIAIFLSVVNFFLDVCYFPFHFAMFNVTDSTKEDMLPSWSLHI